MARSPAPHTQRALELLRTHPPGEALSMLREEGYDTTIGAVYGLKNRTMGGSTGLARTNVDASMLIRPEWHVRQEHQGQMDGMMLRALARRLQGMPLGSTVAKERENQAKLNRWIRARTAADEVIDYDAIDGFIRVPRRYWSPAPSMRWPLDHEFIRDPHRNDDGTFKKAGL